MPLPGDNPVGRRHGSYTPGQDHNDTPFKPVPLAFQQADGTLPMDQARGIDQNRNAKQERPRTRRQAEADRENRKRTIYATALICILIIILLAIILPLAICLSTDLCSSSTSTAEAKTDERPYQARLAATLTAQVLSDSAVQFGDYLNTTFEADQPRPTTLSPRKRRDVDRSGTDQDGSIDQDQSGDQFRPIDRYMVAKIRRSLLESIKSSRMCQDIDCTDLAFDFLRIENDVVLKSGFSMDIGSDAPITLDPDSLQEINATTVRNFSNAFMDVFPGYRLSEVDLAFDLIELCNFTAVYCSNFTNITDTFPTPVPITDAIETTTVPDRSVLLNESDSFQLFTFSTASDRWSSSTGSSVSTSTTKRIGPTMAVVPLLADGMANCSNYGFMCASQDLRVGTRERCDGVYQCPDGSDEQFCETCRTSFMCPNGDGSWMCQRGTVICDGQSQCPTDYDEGPVHCKTACLASEYRCKNSNACIPKRWLCDGDTQCPMGDDEVDCTIPSKCNNNALFCVPDQRCIAQWSVCNGVLDCSDGSDESRCSCVECSGKQVALCSAPYGKCILKSRICDGIKDCPNGEDERKCPS